MKTGKEKYLNRLSAALLAFDNKQLKKKQLARKRRIKNHGSSVHFVKQKSNYRKRRDAEISKISRSSTGVPWKQIIAKVFPGGHPFFKDETCKRYIDRSVKNHSRNLFKAAGVAS